MKKTSDSVSRVAPYLYEFALSAVGPAIFWLAWWRWWDSDPAAVARTALLLFLYSSAVEATTFVVLYDWDSEFRAAPRPDHLWWTVIFPAAGQQFTLLPPFLAGTTVSPWFFWGLLAIYTLHPFVVLIVSHAIRRACPRSVVQTSS